MELPKRIVVLSHRTLHFENLDKNTRLTVNVRHERLSLPHEKGGVAFETAQENRDAQTRRPPINKP